MSDPLLTYQDCAEYFNPPLHRDTIHDWFVRAELPVFIGPVRGMRGNKTVRVRKSVWEKFLTVRERKLQRKKSHGKHI
jgi:hypothetical protein